MLTTRSDNITQTQTQTQIHNLGIDVATKDVRNLVNRLKKLKTVQDAVDGGAYREDAYYSQVHVTTEMTEGQLDGWLCNTTYSFVGVFKL